ncbi:trypco2 family protein [Streptomyces inhibens]|uniref:trypco2 family protein n=1 Tax=Streptomyces inhibens TaxID=2293571 RepID=UPI00402AC61B
MTGIGISDTIRALRQELVAAVNDGEGQPVRFHVDSVDLEMQVEVTASAEVNGGIKFWVLTAGGKATGGASTTHTVSLHLKAETADGGRVVTSNHLELAD